MKTLKEAQIEHVLKVLKFVDYNRAEAARVLNICYRTMRNYIRDYEKMGVVVPYQDEYVNNVENQNRSDILMNREKKREEKSEENIHTYNYFATGSERLYYLDNSKREPRA